MSGDQPAEDVAPEPSRTPPRRRGAIPAALASLAEGFVRDSLIIGTSTLALVVAVGGLLSGSAGPAITGVVGGVGGAVLLVATVARHWPVGRQWLAIVAVLAVQVGLIAVWTG
ncbi:hypothetical protein [Jiangella alba]|uniref:Uncharacterized protein n=1 Tax=Jiangella alba TaxID=561176 RepID=A0A1H5MB88_9ACTN|nr:hypothetical protein [Jiangella alba]SEE86566.1 hypothetical protein SAMN04488561_3053 [Jiangella alba]